MHQSRLFVLVTPTTLTYDLSSPLCAVLICKDEAANIGAALDSLDGRVAQIVVVDTGSSDETAQICAQRGAELHFREWTGDFAAARNHALQFARRPWILALDADERLDELPLPELTALLEDESIGGLRVTIRSQLGEGDQFHEHRYPRLFRRHPQIRYRGAVHEQIGAAIEESGLRITDCPVVIQHLGYAVHDEQKAARNRALLEQELQRQPDDAWLRYHLGQTEFADGNRDKAAAHFEQALAGDGLSAEQRSFARLRLAQAALANNKYSEVLRHTEAGCDEMHQEGFRMFMRGLAYALMNRRAEALPLLEAPAARSSSLVDQERRQQLLDLCRRT